MEAKNLYYGGLGMFAVFIVLLLISLLLSINLLTIPQIQGALNTLMNLMFVKEYLLGYSILVGIPIILAIVIAATANYKNALFFLAFYFIVWVLLLVDIVKIDFMFFALFMLSLALLLFSRK